MGQVGSKTGESEMVLRKSGGEAFIAHCWCCGGGRVRQRWRVAKWGEVRW